MAKAQANGAVYKRMSAKLGNPNNGTGAIDPLGNVPGGSYPRKSAGNASNGGATYKRKVSKASAANTINDGYQTNPKTVAGLPVNGGSKGGSKKTGYAD